MYSHRRSPMEEFMNEFCSSFAQPQSPAENHGHWHPTGRHGGPSFGRHGGPSFESHGGPSFGNHGGPSFESHGGASMGGFPWSHMFTRPQQCQDQSEHTPTCSCSASSRKPGTPTCSKPTAPTSQSNTAHTSQSKTVLKEKNVGPPCPKAETTKLANEKPEGQKGARVKPEIPEANTRSKSEEDAREKMRRVMENLMIGAMEGIEAVKKSENDGNTDNASPFHDFMNEMVKHSQENEDPRELFQSLMSNLSNGDQETNPFSSIFLNGPPSWFINGCGHQECPKQQSQTNDTQPKEEKSTADGPSKNGREEVKKEEDENVEEDCEGCGKRDFLKLFLGGKSLDKEGEEKEEVKENLSQPIRKLPNGEEEFHLVLDASQFNPNDITVKTEDGKLILEAGVEKEDGRHGGSIKRQYRREIPLPDNVQSDQLTCSLKSNGSLLFQAPVAIKETSKNIQIRLD